MAVEIIESNVDLIPGATSSRIEDGSHIYLDNGDKLKIRRY